MISDVALARRLERMDTLGEVWYCRKHADLYSDAGATYEEIAGGVAAFAGVDSPMTQGFGLGLNGEVASEDLDRFEVFFRSRRAPINIEVCPLADESLVQQLSARGYRVVEFSNVLVREIEPARMPVTIDGGVRVREVKPEEYFVWIEAVARGFSDNPDFLPVMREAGMVFFYQENTRKFLVDVEGIVSGGGALSIYDGIANIFGTSTIKSFRGKGSQSALIRACLDEAAEAGCTLAMATTMCGTISQRNFERQGFHIAYTRCKFARD
ncbi:MAG: hypothetical protein KF868_01775 [Acidobacteria bacterium]|nr:hypothetical protein [Acidobacteriota bacterium]